MSVVPIGHPWLTQADIKALMSYGQMLVNKGLAGACVPGTTDDGCPLVALVDPVNEELLFAIGKEYGWYYAIDGEGGMLADSLFLEDVLEALPTHWRATFRLCS